MPETLLEAIALKRLPAFVTGKSELRILRRLHGAGYVDARFFPEHQIGGQFAKLHGFTPQGRRMLDLLVDARRWQGQ